MFTVFDICDLFVDGLQQIGISDLSSPEYDIVYKGTIYDIPCKYKDLVVESIDNVLEDGVVVFNVNIGGE